MSVKESQLPNSQAAIDAQPAISIAASNAIKLENYSDKDLFEQVKNLAKKLKINKYIF